MIEVGLQFRQGIQKLAQLWNVLDLQGLRVLHTHRFHTFGPGALPALPECFVDIVSRVPLRHACRAKTKGLRRQVHPAAHVAVQLIELGLQHRQALMHGALAIIEFQKQCLDFRRGKARI
ncbi:hypothetical protein D3C87_973210 [compost metagenome]